MISASNTTNRQGRHPRHPPGTSKNVSLAPLSFTLDRPLLFTRQISFYLALDEDPITAASRSRNDVCPAPSLVHSRSAPLPTSSASLAPRPERRPVYSSSIISGLLTTPMPSGLYLWCGFVCA